MSSSSKFTEQNFNNNNPNKNNPNTTYKVKTKPVYGRWSNQHTLDTIDEDIEDIYDDMRDIKMDCAMRINKVALDVEDKLYKLNEMHNKHIENLHRKIKTVEEKYEKMNANYVVSVIFNCTVFGLLAVWIYMK